MYLTGIIRNSCIQLVLQLVFHEELSIKFISVSTINNINKVYFLIYSQSIKLIYVHEPVDVKSSYGYGMKKDDNLVSILFDFYDNVLCVGGLVCT